MLKELKVKRLRLSDLLTKKAESNILFARQRLFEFGNKPNQFLARRARNSPQKTFISAISDEDPIRQTDNTKINECFQKFYETLYASELDNNTLTSGNFLDGLKMPQLTDE